MRIVHAALHGVDATRAEIDHALELGRNGIVEFSESYPAHVHDYLASRLDWHHFTGSGTRVDARGRHVAHDVSIMVHIGRPVLEHGSFKAASEVPASLKVAPDRWVVWTLLEIHGHRLLIVGVHPDAVPTPGTAREVEYVNEWNRVDSFVSAMRRSHGHDLRVLLLGDLNNRDAGEKDSPAEWLRTMHMSWESDGLDWIAWSKNMTVGPLTVIPPAQDGQDHPWLVADAYLA